MITKIFKGRSDEYGLFARIENDKLVIGTNSAACPLRVEHLFEGSVEAFINSTKMIELRSVNPELATDISNYYSDQKFGLNKKQEKHMTKLCEIEVDRKDSLQELCYHLTANGYTVQTAVVWKEYPNTGIDYWQIAIFDKEKN